MPKAKILTDVQLTQAVAKAIEQSPEWALRNVVMLLLSFKAGLRAIEISQITWGMVLDANGLIDENIVLDNKASKGGYGGRTIPMHPKLADALRNLQAATHVDNQQPHMRIIRSSKGGYLRRQSIVCWFRALYLSLGWRGSSSHSGRRTFGTKIARRISAAGGSLYDLQRLMGHANIENTMEYVDENEAAKRRVINNL